MDLSKLQAEFAQTIRDPKSAVPNSLGIPEQDVWRFNIYRNNYFHGLIEKLGEAYPMAAHLVGREAFAALAHHYLRQFPLHDVSLALVGNEFVPFLTTLSFPVSAPANKELIGDAAALDRACLETLHAPEGAKLAAESLQHLGEALAEVRFVVHPATRIVPSRQALVMNWERYREGGEPVDGPAQGALVTRSGGKVMVRALSAAATLFGQCLMNSDPVMDSYERAVSVDDAFDPTQCFSDFLLAGAFSSIHPTN